MFNIGDKVSVLDDDINGIITSINNREISIETTDGFTMTFFVNELIKVNDTSILSENTGSFNSSKIKIEKEEPKPRSFVKVKKNKYEIPAPEFDLHIEKLVPNFRGMSNFEMLTLQTDTAKRHLEFSIRNRIPKIVFIHGVGEGVLKAELDFLFGRYDQIFFQEANYQKYGQGATEVFIKQNTK
jgi:hypothetical protein